MKTRTGLKLLLAPLIFGALLAPPAAFAESDSRQGFYAVWRLLSQDQKTQFVAGYLQGWKDASRVTDILIEHVRQNPDDAVASLERIRQVYEVADGAPTALIGEIDRFFADPKNQSAAFSLALSTAQKEVR